MSDLRTPLSKVKGLGSAKEGTHHFWHQRLTALLLLPLLPWLCFSLAAMPTDYNTLIDWIRHPLATVGLVLLIFTTFYHAQMGLQVIIEDYVSSHAKRTATLLISNLLCLLFGAVGILAVLKISFGA